MNKFKKKSVKKSKEKGTYQEKQRSREDRICKLMIDNSRCKREISNLEKEVAVLTNKLDELTNERDIVKGQLREILNSSEEKLNKVISNTKNSVMAEIPLPQEERLKRISSIEVYDKNKHGEPIQFFVQNYKQASIFQSDLSSHDPNFLVLLRNKFSRENKNLATLLPKYSDFLTDLVNRNTAKGVNLKTLSGLLGSYNRKFN